MAPLPILQFPVLNQSVKKRGRNLLNFFLGLDVICDYLLTRTNDGNISCGVLVGRFIPNIMMILSHIHIHYFPYQDINTSPCDYSGISKPVEKVPCKYVINNSPQTSLHHQNTSPFLHLHLSSHRALSLLTFSSNAPPASLFCSQARGVSLDCAADHIPSCKYPVTKTSYWDR